MANLAKSNNRRKNTKIIDKQRIIEIMKSNINPKTNNPNYSKVCNLTGVDRKTLARWWDKREKIASSLHKNNRNKLSSAKFKGMFPEMEDTFYERLINIMGHLLPQKVGSVVFCVEKTILLGK